MKKKYLFVSVPSLVLFAALLNAATVPLHAFDYYRVTVSRVEKDLYRDHGSKNLIETRYCYEYATRDEAVLRWEGRYGNNKLIFSTNTSCDVIALR